MLVRPQSPSVIPAWGGVPTGIPATTLTTEDIIALETEDSREIETEG